MTHAATIDLSHVAKTYRGKVHALRGIRMRVHPGEIFGFLGPNGAGKTTLVKILMTVVRPTRCEGTLLGGPVGHKPTLARIGYLPEHHRFPEYLTGEQVLDFYGAMSGVRRRERRGRIPGLLELVGMSAWADRKVGSYSKGMRQRIGIAQALVNDPELVLLDEPTDGVDPVGRRDIRNILAELKSRGKTVFLNSHMLSELEMVCDRVAILVQGSVARQGTIGELTHDRLRYEVELEGEGVEEIVRGALTPLLAPGSTGERPAGEGEGAPAVRSDGRLLGPAGKLASGVPIEVHGPSLRLGTTDAKAIQPVLDALRARGGVIRAVRPVRPSLEELFMEAVIDPQTGRELPPGSGPPPARAKGGRR